MIKKDQYCFANISATKARIMKFYVVVNYYLMSLSFSYCGCKSWIGLKVCTQKWMLPNMEFFWWIDTRTLKVLTFPPILKLFLKIWVCRILTTIWLIPFSKKNELTLNFIHCCAADSALRHFYLEDPFHQNIALYIILSWKTVKYHLLFSSARLYPMPSLWVQKGLSKL